MTMFLLGALALFTVGVIVGLVFDEDTREAALSLLWAGMFGVPTLLWMLAALALRLLPASIRPRMVRGRRMSTAALDRIARRAEHEGWVVSSRVTSIIVLKRKKTS